MFGPCLWKKLKIQELKRKQAMEIRNSKLQNKINKSNNEALIQENRKKDQERALKLEEEYAKIGVKRTSQLASRLESELATVRTSRNLSESQKHTARPNKVNSPGIINQFSLKKKLDSYDTQEDNNSRFPEPPTNNKLETKSSRLLAEKKIDNSKHKAEQTYTFTRQERIHSEADSQDLNSVPSGIYASKPSRESNSKSFSRYLTPSPVLQNAKNFSPKIKQTKSIRYPSLQRFTRQPQRGRTVDRMHKYYHERVKPDFPPVLSENKKFEIQFKLMKKDFKSRCFTRIKLPL